MEKKYVIGVIGCSKRFNLSDYLKTEYEINVLDDRVFTDVLKLKNFSFTNVVRKNVTNLGRQLVFKKINSMNK